MFAFKDQPLKTVYTLYFSLSVLFVRLPYWVVVSSIPFLRPRRTWSMKRSLTLHAVRAFYRMFYTVGFKAPEGTVDDSKNPDATGFVWVEPVPSNLVVGEVSEVAQRNGVEPARVFGYWYGVRDQTGKHGQAATKDERVFLFLHGGGYVMSSGAPTSVTANIIRGILETSNDVVQRIFSLEYRLSSSPPYKSANPFPAALLDSLSAYHYLTQTLGFEPTNIVIGGDSAGGHLAASLVRYLISSGLPPLSSPRALLCLSPTMDWACTHEGRPDSTMRPNAATDFVGIAVTSGYTAASILGSLTQDELETNPWFSPSSLKLPRTDGLFAGFPPTCIVAGGAEQTLDAMKTFQERLERDIGTEKVTMLVYPEAFHDWLTLKAFEPERTDTLRDIRKWLRGVYSI